jgi:hypothetical protein
MNRNTIDELMDSFIEVRLPDDPEKGENGSFLVVKETLSRIGVASRPKKTLYQSCHILHKQGRYFITHFKELFALDGASTDFDETDKARRNTIANLLHEWELVELVDPDKSAEPVLPVSKIFILPFRDKEDWTLQTKYSIGSKRQSR